MKRMNKTKYSKMQAGGSTPVEMRMQGKQDPFEWRHLNTQCPPGYQYSTPDNQCKPINGPIQVPQQAAGASPALWHNDREFGDMFNSGLSPDNPTYNSEQASNWQDPNPPNMNIKSSQSPLNNSKSKIDPYFALQGVTNGLSWLSGIVDRNRQNQYRNNQFSSLGQLDPLPVSNFQPNPFSLYAKYGGKLQRGGRQPITVTNPNDPRLKAYNDSLNLYNKNYNDAKNSDPLMNVNEVIPLVGNEGVSHADKRTGIQPVGMYRSIDLDKYNAYWPAFKKPVQQVAYQKPQPNQSQGYNDSLKTYNLIKDYNNNIKTSNTWDDFSKFYDSPKGKELKALVIKNKYNIPDGPKKSLTVDPSHIRNAYEGIFPKPVGSFQKPVEIPEKIFPAPVVGQSKPAQITTPAQSQMPEQSQDGQVIYGPSNGVIGYMNKGQFTPIERRDHLSKANQVDIDLLNNPDALQKYVKSTPRFKRGGRFMGINPSHKGFCSPLSKSTCTGHRRALALTLKKHHGFHE